MPYSEIILSTHAFIKKSELSGSVDKAKRLFHIVSKFEPDVSVDIFAETSTHFGFPLYYRDFSLHTEHLVDVRTMGAEASFTLKEDFELRDMQKPVIDSFLQSIANGKTGWLLNSPTGSGKTVMGCAMIQALGRATLIIVPRDNLIKQWIERILDFTNLKRDDIGIAQQDVCDYRGKKIVVGMVHSLAKDKYTEEFKSYFGCVVWDEVHVVGAQTFSQTIGMFPAKYRIGMSATLSRKDGMEDVYKLAIGQVNLSPAKLTTLVSPKVFIRSFKTTKKHPYLSKMKDAKSRRGVLISELANDTARNALIAVYAKKFADSGRRIIIFSDRVEQLKFLKDVLTKRHGMSAASIGLFTGSTKEGNRKVILQHSKIILATFGVMAMGVDVPDLRAIIFGTPLSDVAQAVGRILRLCEGAKDPVVLDIVDSAYPDCVRWGYMRQKYYVDTAKATLYEVT